MWAKIGIFTGFSLPSGYTAAGYFSERNYKL